MATATPALADAYPLAPRGLELLAALLPLDAEQRRAHYAALDATAIADLFLAATEVRRLVEREVRPNLNRETADRFLAEGSDAVERAVRAHWREHPQREALALQMGEDAAVRTTAAAWRRQLAEREAHAEAAEQRANEREVQVRTWVAFFDFMRRASRQLTMPLAERFPPMPAPLGYGPPRGSAAHG